jgi:hypothetical protein
MFSGMKSAWIEVSSANLKGSGSFYRKIISPKKLTKHLSTETPFDRMPFDQKVILPKKSFERRFFTER